MLFATAELAPIAAVGGLAQAAAGLVAELRRQGVDVDVVMPDYGGIELADEVDPRPRRAGLGRPGTRAQRRARRRRDAQRGRGAGSGAIASVPAARRPRLAGQRPPLPRVLPGGRGDRRGDPPDVLHLNDWHTGAALAALDGSIPSVLSLHNIAYQGVTDGAWLRHLGPRGRHYEWWGGTNPLSGAIALADAIVAVSPTHASEILTPDGGFGLDGPLRNRWAAVSGILNGIDTAVWDPATDPSLVANYSAADQDGRPDDGQDGQPRCGAHAGGFAGRRRPAGGDGHPAHRAEGRRPARADRAGPAPDPAAPRRARVGRGGDRRRSWPPRRPTNPDWFSFVEGYDEQLAHLLFGGADLFLMPSRFEPCGLTQMQAMRYGAIPVVTDVGGLHDTVADADDEPDGTGFVRRRRRRWRSRRRCSGRRAISPTAAAATPLIGRGMKRDWSWSGPAGEYVELYERLAGRRRASFGVWPNRRSW